MADTAEQIVDIEYLPGPTALKAHRDRKRVKYAWGPIRTGKSVWACWRIYAMCEKYAELGISVKAIVLRDTYRNLEDTTIKTWLEWFPEGVMGQTIQSTPMTFELWTWTKEGKRVSHEVLFRHGQTAAEASNFLSSDYGVIFLEEVAPAFTPSGLVSPGIAEEVFNLAISRLCQKGIDYPELVMTSNPPPMQHWASKRFIDLSQAELTLKQWAHYWFPPVENEKNIRAGFYDELLKTLPEDMARRFIKGERVAIYPGLPIFQKDFSERMHVRDDLKPIPNLPITLCVDSSGLAPAALFTQIDHKGRWLWLKEIQGGYVDGKLSEQIGAKRFAAVCRMVAADLFPGFSFNMGYGDPYKLNTKSETDEKSWAQYFKAEGFTLSPGITTITDRIEGIRERLNIIIEGNPGILINRSGCPLAIEGLSGGYRWGLDPLASKIAGAEPVKDIFSHTMDAAGHAARKLFPIVKVFKSEVSKQSLPPSAMAS